MKEICLKYEKMHQSGNENTNRSACEYLTSGMTDESLEVNVGQGLVCGIIRRIHKFGDYSRLLFRFKTNAHRVVTDDGCKNDGDCKLERTEAENIRRKCRDRRNGSGVSARHTAIAEKTADIKFSVDEHMNYGFETLRDKPRGNCRNQKLI